MEACPRSPRSRLEAYRRLLRQSRWADDIANGSYGTLEIVSKAPGFRRSHHRTDRHLHVNSNRRFHHENYPSMSIVSNTTEPTVRRPLDEDPLRYCSSSHWRSQRGPANIQNRYGGGEHHRYHLVQNFAPPLLPTIHHAEDPRILDRPLPAPRVPEYCHTTISQENPRTKSNTKMNQPKPRTFEEAFSSTPLQLAKRSRKSNALDILVSATLELGPLQAAPTAGCSCPRSNCIKLYCDCFKAGSKCTDMCSCTNCKNTEKETHASGERIKAIKNTLARNPRAFTGGKKEAVPNNPGDIVCNCVKSRCLKLYCHCFHAGKTCNSACLCVDCLNTKEESIVGGERNLAIQNCLEKRPDAFTKKPKIIGAGCACKNNRCLKKYCDCFRFGLCCTDKCTCRECGNTKASTVTNEVQVRVDI